MYEVSRAGRGGEVEVEAEEVEVEVADDPR